MLEGRSGVTQVVSCLGDPELYVRGSFMGGSSPIPPLVVLPVAVYVLVLCLF